MRKIAPLYALQAGWVRYKNRAGMYTAFTVLMLILSMVAGGVSTSIGSVFSGIPFLERSIVAILTSVFGALISMGWYHFARKDEQGLDVEFGDFFDGFKVNARQLIAVSVIIALISQLFTLVVPSEMLSLTIDEQTQDPEELMMMFQDLKEVYLANINSILIFAVISTVFGLSVLFAQYRASLEGEDPLTAIQWSAAHVLPNTLRIIVLFIAVIAVAALVVVFTLGLGLLVAVPWISLSFYDAYNQLLPEPEVPSTLDQEFTAGDD